MNIEYNSIEIKVNSTEIKVNTVEIMFTEDKSIVINVKRIQLIP